jgi:hypothetical protein
MKIAVLTALVAIACAGCAKSSAIPLAADMVQITTSAAPVCGQAGAQSVAARRAAIETISRGYDKFMILDGRYQNDVRVIGHTPVQAHTTSNVSVYGGNGYATGYGTSRTTYSGGNPIVGGSHNQGFMVKMFKDGDPAGANAVPARQSLGPNWKEAVKEGGTGTC